MTFSNLGGHFLSLSLSTVALMSLLCEAGVKGIVCLCSDFSCCLVAIFFDNKLLPGYLRLWKILG